MCTSVCTSFCTSFCISFCTSFCTSFRISLCSFNQHNSAVRVCLSNSTCLSVQVVRKRMKKSKGQDDTAPRPYQPCQCKGDCTEGCPCLNEGHFCEKFCACGPKCGSRFQGCVCKGGCKNKGCPCMAAGQWV